MKLSLDRRELLAYIGAQLDNCFPDKYALQGKDVESAYNLALDRLENCFKYISFPEYCDGKGQTHFSHLHSDQYSQFLYFFSNSLWKISANRPLCDKLICLNKMLNGMFFSYKGILPDIFFFAHPIGTVLGNAAYSDFLVVFQNVTVNTGAEKIEDGLLPKLGKGLYLGTGAKIIGRETIGDRVSIGVDAVVYNQAVDDDKVVIKDTESGLIIRDRIHKVCKAQFYFNVDIK